MLQALLYIEWLSATHSKTCYARMLILAPQLNIVGNANRISSHLLIATKRLNTLITNLTSITRRKYTGEHDHRIFL